MLGEPANKYKQAAAACRRRPSVWLPVGIIAWVLLLGYLPRHIWR